MKFTENLARDFKLYLINKDTVKKNTVQMLRAEILNKSKELHRDLSDNEILEIIAKEIKQKQNSIQEFEKGNRNDLIIQTNEEIMTLSKYMPELLSIDELKSIISNIQSEINAYQIKDMGKVNKGSKITSRSSS